MTEPVAYIQIKDGKAYSVLRKGTPNDEYTPVYTSEQLHPRVKMTQTEFDELNSMSEFSSVYGAMLALYSGNVNRSSKLLKRFSGNYGQTEFANLWFDYHIKHKAQDELIEIAPDMKWFVRSKEFQNFYLIVADKFTTEPYVYLSRNELDEAQQFETKEEAELWTNPLTEAVQLPVNGDND